MGVSVSRHFLFLPRSELYRKAIARVSEVYGKGIGRVSEGYRKGIGSLSGLHRPAPDLGCAPLCYF